MQTSSISVTESAFPQRPQSNTTLKDFLVWLESLPADTKFCDSFRTATCPIAQFLGRPAVWGDTSLPKWALSFMMSYDSGISTSLEDALAIAKTLQAELPSS